MSKKKNYPSIEPQILSTLHDAWDEEWVNEQDDTLAINTLHHIMEVSSRQTEAAMELTHLITHHLPSQIKDTQSVLTIFREALKTVRETSPLEELLQELKGPKEVPSQKQGEQKVNR